ncbi:MAG: PIG-L deacetylase family protein [Actinomycetota bacterium]|nr:PIG-L deacetylase family protein [Actinomycetota bacterium]
MATDVYDELAGSQAPLEVPTRVLTIGAHPDDAEFGAGATLARWADSGAEITMLIVTDGSKGAWDPEIDQNKLVARRRAEQARAAAIMGAASVIFLDQVDGELEYSMDLRRRIAGHIRRARPDVVLTHDPWQRYQLHPDHRVTGFLAIDAVVSAREPLAYRDLGLPAHRPSRVLLWSADEPDHVEPVTPEWFERKVDALLCHSSQSETTMGGAESGGDQRVAFVDRLTAWHTENGQQFRVGPAEIFKQITP